MPCGPYSLVEYAKANYVPMFALSIYSVLNYKSDWDRGVSHKLSFRDLAELTRVYRKNKSGKWMRKSRVSNAIKWLCENDWLIKKVNGNGELNGEGSAFEKMFQGKMKRDV